MPSVRLLSRVGVVQSLSFIIFGIGSIAICRNFCIRKAYPRRNCIIFGASVGVVVSLVLVSFVFPSTGVDKPIWIDMLVVCGLTLAYSLGSADINFVDFFLNDHDDSGDEK